MKNKEDNISIIYYYQPITFEKDTENPINSKSGHKKSSDKYNNIMYLSLCSGKIGWMTLIKFNVMKIKFMVTDVHNCHKLSLRFGEHLRVIFRSTSPCWMFIFLTQFMLKKEGNELAQTENVMKNSLQNHKENS